MVPAAPHRVAPSARRFLPFGNAPSTPLLCPLLTSATRSLHPAFRPRLATKPGRIAITSPPSGCEGDLHPQAVNHARRTHGKTRTSGASFVLSAQTSYNYLILHRLEDEKPFRSGAHASNESASSFTILFNSEFPSALLG